jgi:hypothetical protein
LFLGHCMETDRRGSTLGELHEVFERSTTPVRPRVSSTRLHRVEAGPEVASVASGHEVRPLHVAIGRHQPDALFGLIEYDPAAVTGTSRQFWQYSLVIRGPGLRRRCRGRRRTARCERAPQRGYGSRGNEKTRHRSAHELEHSRRSPSNIRPPHSTTRRPALSWALRITSAGGGGRRSTNQH